MENFIPCSEIANKMTVRKTKVAYNIVHGIALYFHS